ncbi:Phosphate-selective porin [Sphingobium sp. AP50]|uniref:porin n=1 Tax=Sphingobium sp. AP50 TaxID=1884369 RepID=UPI0008D1257B|nr:porin [Sphingobium sp. AP50]SEJ35198.1 Phosphate-selective porin [Sphingobium sp. AP50]
MTLQTRLAAGTALAMLMTSTPVAAQVQGQAPDNAALQRQIDELKAQVQALTVALSANKAASPVAVAPAPAGEAAPAALAAAPAPPVATPVSAAPKAKAWYEKLSLRGYTQMRYNAFLSGDDSAPSGQSRLRSVHDGSISDRGGFSLRRARLVLQGDVSDRVSLYLQSDFASAVNNQAGSERREGFVQLRDAYADVFLDDAKSWRVRFGQSKVPFGWENMQSSSNRLTLDRSDAINSAVPSERDLGIVGYYTPPSVQKIWDRLGHDGQKLFGNYGAFGVGVFNGQGTNRTEQNRGLMKVAFATWPFELDGLGDAFEGQVFEIGGSAMMNDVQPELRSGGVSAIAYDDDRVGLHAMLYPQPFGIQAEWNWGKGPEFDLGSQSIETKKLRGGYVQMMYRLPTDSIGALMPYGRWQHYRGGWKASTNAPRLETDEFELGVEWQPWKALEFTFAYARMKRAEADERRTGRAEGDLIRTQVQWNY